MEVIDSNRKARRLLGSARTAKLDMDRIVKKTIEEVKGLKYISLQEKPGGIKCLRKEVKNGTI